MAGTDKRTSRSGSSLLPDPHFQKGRGHVLIIDDSEITSLITRRILEGHGYNAEVVRTGEIALERLQSGGYDLLCLDVGLPGMDGHEVCRRVRRSAEYGHLPILMVSASFTDESNVVRGLEAGANDYVRIPFSQTEFLGRADGLVRLKRAEDSLRAMAIEDPLTHLGNRNHFFHELQREMARTGRHQSPLCLALVDIDHFKRINSTLGRQTGDEVLCGMAALLRENVRVEDAAFRAGGDEFAILLVETEVKQAYTVVNRVLKQVESTDFSLLEKRLHTSASIGLGQYDAEKHTDPHAFVADVEKALRGSRKKGRDRIALTK